MGGFCSVRFSYPMACLDDKSASHANISHLAILGLPSHLSHEDDGPSAGGLSAPWKRPRRMQKYENT